MNNKKDFLVELLVEEIPARFQTTAIETFSKLITDGFDKNRIEFSDIRTFITPRRMVFAAKLNDTVASFTEERKGPQISAPTEIIDNFLKSVGVSRSESFEKEVNNKTFVFVKIVHNEKKTADLLESIVKTAIFSMPWPKSMRWGGHAFTFVRPLRNIMCIFNGTSIDVDMGSEIALHSVDYSFGHRFMAPQKVFATNINDYMKKMREAFVIVDQNERRKIILDACANGITCDGHKIDVSITKDLLEEVVGLVEYPVVMVGKISEKFMELPDEVITTTMQSHQRYFPTYFGKKLAPYFVFVANNVAEDGGAAIRAGNQRVLSARLADALFFFEHDRTIPLERHLDDLKKIAFNDKLGSVYDRTLRIVEICENLNTEVTTKNSCGQLMLARNSGEILKRAALLAKCDLPTNMVCEFTELQGIMGAHYAHFQGESDEVCNIIRDQYKMVDDLFSPLSALYSMADKIDAITSLFAIGKAPTGSKDPFALRRAAIGIVKIIMKYEMEIDLRGIIENAFERVKKDTSCNVDPNTVSNVLTFIHERLRVVLKEDGIDHSVINSVFAVPQDIHSMQKKAKILDSILKSEVGGQLISICRRARNIIQGSSGTFVDESIFTEAAEIQLFAAIKEFEGHMIDLSRSDVCVIDAFDAKLKYCLAMEAPMSSFFKNVLVNAEDKAIQSNRIGILAKFVAVLSSYLPEVSEL